MKDYTSPRSLACGCDRVSAQRLTSLATAQSQIASTVSAITRVDQVPLAAALGRVLAKKIRAKVEMPPFDNSAMDGYAVATADFYGFGPWSMPVVATAYAGHGASAPLQPGTAVRIFTGAPIPPGADAVIMQEDSKHDDDVVQFDTPPKPGQNRRMAGEDQACGTVMLRAGIRLGPREIAAAAAAGHGFLNVTARLRVAIMITGDEVTPAGDTLAPGTIWDVNTPMIQAALTASGADIVRIVHAPDTLSDTVAQLRKLIARCDLVVTTGGVSVGEADFILPAMSQLGAETLFSGVAVKPGKPVSLARIGDTHLLALPGNPLSALVIWEILGKDLLRRMSGEARTVTPHMVRLNNALRHKVGRDEFRPVHLGPPDASGMFGVSVPSSVHSGRISTLAQADGLLHIPAQIDALPKGALCAFYPFET